MKLRNVLLNYQTMLSVAEYDLITIAIAESDQLLQSVRSLSDYSQKINIGLNSFPGSDERIIFSWVKEHDPRELFFAKNEFGTIAEKTPDNQIIKSAVIYVVNPLKSTGFLCWKNRL